MSDAKTVFLMCRRMTARVILCPGREWGVGRSESSPGTHRVLTERCRIDMDKSMA